MAIQRVTFEGGTGAELAARLDMLQDQPHAICLFAHCFTCGKDIAAATRIARGLVDAGYGVLRFDFTGLGHSEGEFASTNFSSNVEDLLAAAAWLREHHAAPGLLVGHSLGGAAVLAAAPRIDECRAVATIGAPSEPSHVEHLFGPHTPEIESRGEVSLELAGRPFTIRNQFLEDIRATNLRNRLGQLGRALMVMHSPVDSTVGIDNAEEIYVAAQHPKSFVSLDRADHMLSNKEDAEFAASVLGAWAARYVSSD
ncbi:MAG: alpha/beta hydrolase [Planctomycetota bacterium]